MAHKEQFAFLDTTLFKLQAQGKFSLFNAKVLDVGSFDVNGSFRDAFESEGAKYYGLDLADGKNVDIVCPVHEFKAYVSYDIVVSGEMLEHDKQWALSLVAMYDLLKIGGWLIITCATTGRAVHGLKSMAEEDNPNWVIFPSADMNGDYYKNLTVTDFISAFDYNMDNLFSQYAFEINNHHHDLYFWGIKK